MDLLKVGAEGLAAALRVAAFADPAFAPAAAIAAGVAANTDEIEKLAGEAWELWHKIQPSVAQGLAPDPEHIADAHALVAQAPAHWTGRPGQSGNSRP